MPCAITSSPARSSQLRPPTLRVSSTMVKSHEGMGATHSRRRIFMVNFRAGAAKLWYVDVFVPP